MMGWGKLRCAVLAACPTCSGGSWRGGLQRNNSCMAAHCTSRLAHPPRAAGLNIRMPPLTPTNSMLKLSSFTASQGARQHQPSPLWPGFPTGQQQEPGSAPTPGGLETGSPVLGGSPVASLPTHASQPVSQQQDTSAHQVQAELSTHSGGPLPLDRLHMAVACCSRLTHSLHVPTSLTCLSMLSFHAMLLPPLQFPHRYWEGQQLAGSVGRRSPMPSSQAASGHGTPAAPTCRR